MILTVAAAYALKDKTTAIRPTLCHAVQICNAVGAILFALLNPVPLLGLHLRQAAVALKCDLLLLKCGLQSFFTAMSVLWAQDRAMKH